MIKGSLVRISQYTISPNIVVRITATIQKTMAKNILWVIVFYMFPVMLTGILGLILSVLMRTGLPFINDLFMGGRR